jgi:hypothetical protein
MLLLLLLILLLAWDSKTKACAIPGIPALHISSLSGRTTKESSRMIWERFSTPQSPIVHPDILSQLSIAVDSFGSHPALHRHTMHPRDSKICVRISDKVPVPLIVYFGPGKILPTVGTSGAFCRVTTALQERIGHMKV